jgi:TonB family protein
MPRGLAIAAIGLCLSLVLHAIVLVWLALLPQVQTPSAPFEVALDVPISAIAGNGIGDPDLGATRTEPDVPVPGGARSAQNIDADERGGGGDERGAREVILLASRAESILLFDSPINNLAQGQTQRIHTARDRASYEHRRATPHPEDAVFLASGHGPHQERRPIAGVDPQPGAREAPQGSLQGGQAQLENPGGPTVTTDGDEPPIAPGSIAARAGAERASPGQGILRGTGERESEAARVAFGRPSVDEGNAATPAQQPDRVRDNDDAELLATSMMQAWVEASERSGQRAGAGRGGVGGGGAPGSGSGQNEGGRASSYGPGNGEYAALDTRDRRYMRWFLVQRRRVHNALRYPRERMLAMDQGTSICIVDVRRDGTLARAPALERTSGFDDMDDAALAAIRAASPFTPLPDDLAPELSVVHIRFPIEFSNPMVR